jgi:hypothetical protein
MRKDDQLAVYKLPDSKGAAFAINSCSQGQTNNVKLLFSLLPFMGGLNGLSSFERLGSYLEILLPPPPQRRKRCWSAT